MDPNPARGGEEWTTLTLAAAQTGVVASFTLHTFKYQNAFLVCIMPNCVWSAHHRGCIVALIYKHLHRMNTVDSKITITATRARQQIRLLFF